MKKMDRKALIMVIVLLALPIIGVYSSLNWRPKTQNYTRMLGNVAINDTNNSNENAQSETRIVQEQTPIEPVNINTPITNYENDPNLVVFNGTVGELINQPETLQCKFTRILGTERTEGTIYVNNGRIRTNLTIKTPGDITIINIIEAFNVGYIWSSVSDQGIYINLQSNQSIFDVSTQLNVGGNDSPLSTTNASEYNCIPWTVDEILFTTPSSVNFQNVTAEYNEQLNQ